MKHVYWNNQNERWIVAKTIKQKYYYFGSYTNVEEAEERVKELISTDWDGLDTEHSYFYRNIQLTSYPIHNRYCVKHFYPEGDCFYESYNDLRQALHDRDFFEECDWDLDTITYNYDSTKPNKYRDVELPALPKRLRRDGV